MTCLKGTGKSTLGRLITALSFNGKMWTDPTCAALFRMIEANRPTVVLDEMENIQNRGTSEYPIVAILKAGYQKGGEVPRIGGRDNERIDDFEVYGPKAICNVLGLEDILADRAIPVTMARQNTDQLKRLCPDQPDFEDDCWFRFRDDFYLLLMQKHHEIARIAKSPPFEVPFAGRNRELFTPLLVIAHFLDAQTGMGYNLQDNVLELCRGKSEQRKMADFNAPDVILRNALLDLLDNKDRIEVSSYQIIEACRAQCSTQQKWLSDTWVGRQLKTMGIIKAIESSSRKTVWVKERNQNTGEIEDKPKRLRVYTIQRSKVR